MTNPEKEIPKGGEACYMESLSKTSMGYTVNVSVIGIDEDNKYYDTKPVKGKSNLIISRSVQQKYGLHIGDNLILTDNAEDMDYAFTIKGVCGYAGVMAVYFAVNALLVRKLKRITPAEVLKNRE